MLHGYRSDTHGNFFEMEKESKLNLKKKKNRKLAGKVSELNFQKESREPSTTELAQNFSPRADTSNASPIADGFSNSRLQVTTAVVLQLSRREDGTEETVDGVAGWRSPCANSRPSGKRRKTAARADRLR